MPWTAEITMFSNDPDEKRVNAVLIWDEGEPDEFRYPKPAAEITLAAAQEMLAEALAAREAARVQRAKETNLATQLANIANS